MIESNGPALGDMASADRQPLVWQKVEWRQGDGSYSFDVQQGGLYGSLTSPHGHSLTIPMVAWYGLLDALAASRKTRERSERRQPPRSHARWSQAEVAELQAAYAAGATIRSLAQTHNRTEQAIESQLARDGLWDRNLREPIGRGLDRTGSPVELPNREAAPPWPPDYWDSPSAGQGSVPARGRAQPEAAKNKALSESPSDTTRQCAG